MYSTKDLGTIAEMRFSLSAFEKGFSVLRPFSDNRPYDFVLEKAGRFIKIQVKSSSAPVNEKGHFHINTARSCTAKESYTAEDCDVIAVYLKSLDLFYLIPIQFISTVSINLYPLRLESRWIEFKNNWHI